MLSLSFLLIKVSCELYRLFKGLTPLWGRQIPYTMMKFGMYVCVFLPTVQGCVCVGGEGNDKRMKY